MKYILILMISFSLDCFGQLRPFTDSYEYNPVEPTLSFKKTKNKEFINLAEVENPYVDGAIDKDSIFYKIIEEEKREIKQRKALGLPLKSRFRTFDDITAEVYGNPRPSQPTGGFGWIFNGEKVVRCAKTPEPNTNLLFSLGLTTLLLGRRKL